MEHLSIVVGVSGGPDSLALLHFLWSQRQKWNLELVAAHVDHMFRGEESYEEAMFVKEFCHHHDIPFELERVNVPNFMKETGKSSQVAARECRYRFYQKVMKKHHSKWLALAHHGDDQMETILMRLTRGSTGKARAGIPFQRPFGEGNIIRPFLCLSKEEIEAYCRFHKLNPRRDPSNEKDDYSRNRFRHHVLPFIKSENGKAHEHFQRFSDDLIEDEKFLEELTKEKMNTVMEKEQDKITVNIKMFLQMPLPLQRRGIQLILNYLYKEKPASLTAIHIEQIVSLMKNLHPSGILDFPEGLRIIRSYDLCHFQMKVNKPDPYVIEITEPGVIALPNGTSMTIERCEHYVNKVDPDTILFDEAQIQFPLIVRTRKDGDRMSLKGMNGTKKVKDIFIDAKIPLDLRDNWPIVTNNEGEIIWLPSLKKSSHACSQEKPYTHYIFLTYKKQ